MAQRLNKKLLLGLGSSLGFLGTGVISGFGINTIVNNGNNFNQDQLALNTLPEADFKTASDYNVATSDMFVDTTNLKRFHFGNTQRGQTVTPYGWLGVFEDSTTVQNRIALTGWNGEILWVNEDYKTANNSGFNVYEMKYDFRTNLIFVLRSGSQNGLIDDNPGSLNLTDVQLDILDAATGQRIVNGGQAISKSDFVNFQNQALSRIRTTFLNDTILRNNKKIISNLFQLDVVSISDTKVLVTWMPNFMLLKNLGFGTFPSFMNIVDFFKDLTKPFIFEKVNPSQINRFSRNIDLRHNPSSEFSPSIGSPNWFRSWDTSGTDSNLNNYALLSNPFFTIGNGNELILHLIVARSRNINNQRTEIIHKTLGFNQNGGHLGFTFDKSEQIGGFQLGNSSSYLNLLNVDTELSSGVAAWSRAVSFGSDFINANLRINRNMFDGNSVVFAYPYAAQNNQGNNNFPIFNVAQLQIDSASGLLKKGGESANKKRNTNWDFGRQFVEHYKKNNGNYNQPNVNKVYPYPNITTNFANLHHNYHRLISVNPFDNTFIYAGKSNLTDRALEQVNANSGKYASFWISTNDKFSAGKAYARPLIIGNDASLNNASVSAYMTDFDNNTNKGFTGLYNDGFTFDPRSLETVGSGQKSLQLYFNQTGTGKNDLYTNNNFRTSKIGLLNDILKQATPNDNNGTNLWVDNIANVSKITNKNLLITGITLDSYSTLIHSRANLEKWYPRTFWNNTKPGNSLPANSFLNENNGSSSERATASVFGTKLNTAEFNSQRAVDLVSAWKDRTANNSKNPPNYSRLFVKGPQIKVRSESIANQLPTATTYPLTVNNFLAGWLPSGGANRFIFTKQENIANASYEIFSSWSRHVRINDLPSTATENFRATEIHNHNGSTPSWFDVRKNNSQTTNLFGQVNNDISINQVNHLRLMLKIAKPKGNLPNWFSEINQDIFNKSYPLSKDALNTETTFEEVLNAFISEKTKRINPGQIDSTNLAIGLGNLRIEGFVALNPKAITNSNQLSIYKNGNQRMIVSNNLGLRIIYNDQYGPDLREIYDQSATNYSDFNKWGFGASGTQVRRNVQTSWTGNLPPSTQKIRASVNTTQLTDQLVRETTGNNDPIFSFKYDDQDKTKLVLTPKNVNWFKNSFFNYNHLLNLFVRFEYHNGDNNWKQLGSEYYTDANLKAMFKNNNALELTGVPAGITQLRFRLIKKTDHDTDGNAFVDLKNFDQNNTKFISVAHTIAVQKVIVDKNWFNEIDLTNANGLLNLITSADLTKYENDIFAKSTSLNNNANLRSKVKLTYQFENQANLDLNTLADKIKQELNNFGRNDQGAFSLWNGRNGLKIKAKFSLVNNDGSIEFVNKAGATITNENDLAGDLKTNLKTQIDLGTYLEQLQNSKIEATQGSQPGQLNAFTLPAKTGNPGAAQFNGKTFAEIETILNKIGLQIRYKKWEKNNSVWSNWLEQKDLVNSYNVNNPAIIIGFKKNPAFNVNLANKGVEITDDTEFQLELAVPKVVKLPTNISQMVDKFNQQKAFEGNTYELTVHDNKLVSAQNEIINALQNANTNGTAGNYDNLRNQLIFEYQLGNSNFSEVTDLKTFLKQQTIDQTNNALKIKLSLKPPANNAEPEFILDPNAKWEITLLENNNSNIKKYIHGTTLDPKVNQVKAAGSFNNITYTYPLEIQNIFEGKKEGLKLQYTYKAALNTTPSNTIGVDSDPENQWVDVKADGLPNEVSPKFDKIFLQILTTNPDLYVYGPDFSSSKIKGEVDLRNLTTMIIVDKNWFNEVNLTNQSQKIEALNATEIQKYENQIYEKSPSLGTTNDALREKVKLIYEFDGQKDLNAEGLAQAIQNKLKDFTKIDQGIFTLFNGNNGSIIKATFSLNVNDGSVQFVNPNNTAATGNDLTGQVISDLTTSLDLNAWLQELQNSKIVAVQGTQPGQLISFTIPGKNGVEGQGQLYGKSFDQIKAILEKVGVKIQYQKWTNGTWSNWLINEKEVNSYNPNDPKIRLGFQINTDYNIKLFNGKDQINNNSAFDLQLALPKLVKFPADNNEIPTTFNQNNPFGGDTYQLTIDQQKIQLAQKAIIDLLKTTNAVNGQTSNYDNLASQLDFQYQLGNSKFASANDLKTFLATQTIDQTSNHLKLKISLKPTPAGQQPEFVLENSQNEFSLQPENNTIIKKYIHGLEYEKQLNNIGVTGDFNNLKYTYPTEIQQIIQNNSQNSASNLKLQYTFSATVNPNVSSNQAAGTDPTKNWVDVPAGGLPTKIDQTINAIYVQIVLKQDRINNFIYGPDKDLNTKVKGKIDLNKIATLVVVDPNLFRQTPLIPDDNNPIFLEQLDAPKLKKYEDIIYQLLGFDTSHPKRNLLTLKYEFNGQGNLSADEVMVKIKEFQKDFNNQQLGILTFWNGQANDQQGFKLNATFATTDTNLIKFVNQQNQPTTNLTGPINTKNLHTKINLTNFINNLTRNETTVQTANSKPGTITSFSPPSMPPATPATFLSGRTYDQIAERLENLKIKIVFRQINGQTQQWVEKAAVKTYDVTTALLPFSFENQSSNLFLSLSNQQNDVIGPGNISHNKVFNLKLNAPKQISINDADLATFLKTQPFTNNTKELIFDKKPVQALITTILERNANEAQNEDFKKAPLEVYFKLDNLQYMSGEELVAHLKTKQDDVSSRAVKFKFVIPANQTNRWLISPEKEYDLYQENVTNPLKIYINDRNLHKDFSQTTFSGDNKKLEWNWVAGISVNDSTGLLQMNDRGQGLKVEYTFNSNPIENSSDIKTGWVSAKPTSFEPQFQQIYIRLTVTDPKKYLYINDGKTDVTKKITLDLSKIKQIIDLQASWLSQDFSTAEMDINSIEEKLIQAYEDKIFAVMAIDGQLKNKITIKYNFNGQNDLDKKGLIAAIKNYKKTNGNDVSLGILQMHNGVIGEKIQSKFSKADSNGNYDLNVIGGPNEFTLDTSKINTTINLENVLTWLKTIKVGVVNKNPNQNPNKIDSLTFPEISASTDEYFNTKSWIEFEQALNNFGVIIQYRSLTNANKNDPNRDWKDGQANINDYDPAIGKIQIRFRFDQNKAKNIKLKLLNNDVISGITNQPTNPFEVQLKIKLMVKINRNFVFKFIGNENAISGNTKFLNIDQAIQEQMVKEIKNENIANNQEFTRLNLLVQYQIGEAQVGGDWRDRESFIKYLENQPTDQTTNKIVFRFAISQEQDNDFEVAGDNYTLSDYQQPGPNIKIKYYINEANLENAADQVNLSGTNIKLNWNWPSGLDVNNQTSLIQSAPGIGLQVQYTLKSGATYEEATSTSIETGWVTNQPQTIPAGTTNLWIRLKALDGYIYGAKNPTIHQVAINLTHYIEVEEEWLQKAFSSVEITNLNEGEIAKITQKILAHINSPDLQNKVEIVFSFNNELDLTPAELAAKIQKLLAVDNEQTYGILQLFNGNSGMKIQANFKIKDNNPTYKILNKKTQTEGTNYQDLDTVNVHTEIDLIASFQAIFQTLITAKQLPGNKIQIEMPAFPNNNLPLKNRTWNEGIQKLKSVGIITEYRTIDGQNSFGNWTEDLTKINTYNPTINQFSIRFQWKDAQAANVSLKINTNDLIDKNNKISKIYNLNLNLPLKLELDKNAITTFINDPISVFGNTKFLTIAADKEEQLIGAIVKFNEKNNPLASQAAGRIEIQYALGNQATNWLNREAFQTFLEEQTTDQVTNQIQFKFVIKPKNNPGDKLDFTIDDAIQELNPHQTPNPGIKIAYYVNKNNWENAASQVAITGNIHQIQWQWNNLNVDNQNLVQVDAGKGLKVQFSTKNGIQYNDPEASDLNQGWVNERPESLLVNSNDLYIRLISAHTGFVYEAEQLQNGLAHKVNLNNFKFLINVSNKWLNQKLIINQNNLINNLTIKDIEKYEDNVLVNVDPGQLRNQVGIVYEFNGKSNLTKDLLFAEINRLLNDFNGANGGVLQLDNGVQGLAIKASFIVQNSPDANGREYDLFEINGQDLTNKIDTTDIKTHIDLRKYINLLKSKKIPVQGADSTTGTLTKILMSDFPTGAFILSGKSFEIMESILAKIGVKFEGKALGNGVVNTWQPIGQINKYDPNNGKIELRLVLDNQKAKNIVLSVLNEQDQDITQQPQERIELILQVPLKIKIDEQIVKTLFINNQSINGNTRFLQINDQNEAALIDAIISDNQQINPNFSSLNGKLKIQYQIKGSQQWQQREQFIDFLKNTKTNWNSNEVKFQFILVDNPNNDFILEANEFVLHEEQIGTKNTAVKIYLHANNYESLADNITITGTNTNFTYNWPTGLPINAATGQIQGIQGLQIQYTTKKGQKNENYNNGINNNPAAGWVDQRVDTIDPLDRYLAIQFVAKDGYVYGAQFKTQSNVSGDDSPSWKVHQINAQTILSEIEIDMKALEIISFIGQFPNINENQIQQLEEQAKKQATTIAGLQEKMKFEYQISWNNQNLLNFTSLAELKKWLLEYSKNNNSDTAGLIKFNAGGSTQFAAITVRLQAINSNEFVVLDKVGTDFNAKKASAEKGRQAKTDQYETVFDLQAYEQVLLNQFIDLPKGATTDNVAGFNPSGMENQPNNVFLGGKTYAEIKTILERLGVVLEFKAPDQNGNQWVKQEQIQALNSKNELLMRFRINKDATKIAPNQLATFANSFKLKTTSNTSGDLDVNKDYATDAIKLKVNLPILIQVNKTDLNTQNLKLQGNTWQVKNKDQILSETKQLISQAKAANTTANTNVDQADLKIQFSLTGLKENNNQWFEIEQLVAILLKRTDQNWNSNEIQVRWWIDENQIDNNGFRYKISDPDPFTLQPKSLDHNAQFKMYIHKKDIYSLDTNIKKQLKASGSTEDYSINDLPQWMAMLQAQAQGLEVQFSNQANPNQNDHWQTYNNQANNLPKPLNPDKDLWFRYQVKPGYEYGDALQNDAEHSNKVKLDTSAIKTILVLLTDWLKQIVLTGNLKDLTITEEKAKEAMIASGNLPTNQNDLVEFEYSFDSQNWYSADAIKTILLAQEGKKDDANFIIRRNDFKVRFSLKTTTNENQYQLKIDNELIDNNNRDKFNVPLITDQINSGVKGYIEIKHLKHFEVANFAIQGTNTKPKLIVTNAQFMEHLMQNYATDQLFDIVITTKKDAAGNWDWKDKKSILQKNNTFINPDTGLIDLGVVLDGNKQVALRFESKNPDYDVYQEGTLHQKGYVIDISSNVKITVEIINPFTRNNKALGLWWTADNDRQQGKYYQGQGGFKIVVADDQGNIDTNSFSSAISWLSNNSGLTQNEINALEFVYHIFESGTTPTAAEIERISNPNLINNYNDSTWQKFSDVMETDTTNGEHFSKPLNLKVGQYVTVALRVKQEFTTGDNIFVLKGNDQSFLDPIKNDGTTPGRAHGYKIQADNINLNKNSLILENTLNFNDAPLDGYTKIKSLNLEKDINDQYLGVDLNLKLYHEFYEKNGNVLITPDKIKLVKRQDNNKPDKNYFKDLDGNDITDDNGNRIPILLDNQNKPTAPIMANAPTLTKLLDNYQDGHFGFTETTNLIDKEKWGLFRNERVTLEVKAIQGIGHAADPDFILEGQKEIELKDLISPQIKFPILNPNNIQYQFNQDDFSRTNITYQHASKPAELPSIDGSSMVATLVKLIKVKTDGSKETIEGKDIAETILNLNNEINKSFFQQLRFETIYEPKTGGTQIINNINLYNLKSLSNGDRIKVQIVAADNDFLWSQAPQPLTINVAGLTAKAPTRNKLRFLRVDQGGKLNGQGSFKVLVNNPDDQTSNANDILQGWKFVLRVWDQDKKIKHDWTADQERISDLNNGDKIEWKLLDEFNNPVEDAYYNTVAGSHEQDKVTGETIFKFNQMHYPNGLTSGVVFKEGIGSYPINSDDYPVDSGFVISGLQDALEVFEISDAAFAKVMAQLEPHYVGLNGQGSINFKEDYLSKNYYVNSNGELYEKPLEQPTFKQQTDADVVEISLADFLANTTFYTSDPNLINYQNGFKFLGNDTNLNNNLSNGDQVWAQFDLQADNNEVNRGISTELNPVTGLKDVVTDPMTPLWYILMAIGGAVTLGGLSLLILWIKRNRKFKK